MAKWGYGSDDGPHTWALHFPHAAGKSQSPINIVSSKIQFDAQLAKHPLNVKLVPSENEIEAKAHNFHVDIHGESTLQGGPLDPSAVYHLLQFHFHWGGGDAWGSEHQMDGASFPSELHLVFINRTKYKDASEALANPDGLAVIGVFITLGNANPVLNALLPELSHVTAGKKHEIKNSMDIAGLLPANTKRYYTYPGSLTTPPCAECVTWIVLADPITVSHDQLEKLRRSHSCGNCGAPDNFRSVHPIGQRQIRSSFQ